MGSEQNDSTSFSQSSFSQSQPKLCANNCGFFGTEQNMNLCSKCYRDLRINEEQAASAKAAMEKSLNPKPPKQEENIANKNNNNDQIVSSAEPAVGSSTTMSFVESSSSGGLTAGGDQVERKVSNRCVSCNKKVGLTGFICKCGSTFCGTHRYPEKHECTFDFKVEGRNAIAMANPLVKADKVERF